MTLTKEIKDILENVVFWDTCPQDYKDKINAYLSSSNESKACGIPMVTFKGDTCVKCGKSLEDHKH